MKKGFTLVEIILSIALITIIGISGFFMYKTDKKEKTLEKIKEDIYRAVNVLIETDGETKKQLYNSKNGAIIPLSKLESEGLIDFNGLDIKDEYVLSMLGSEEESEKCSGTLYNIGSWTKAKDDVIYICGGNSQEIADLKDRVEELEGTSKILKKVIVSNAEKADGITDRSVLGLSGFDKLLVPVDNEYVFTGDVIDNYAIFNNMCWRIMRIQEDGSIKLLLHNQTSSCSASNWSIGEGHYGYTYDYLSDSSGNKTNGKVYLANYDTSEDEENSMKYILDTWFKENFLDKKKYLKEETWELVDNDINKKGIEYNYMKRVSNYYELGTEYQEITPLDFLLSDNDGVFKYQGTKTFNSYIATTYSSDYQNYMYNSYPVDKNTWHLSLCAHQKYTNGVYYNGDIISYVAGGRNTGCIYVNGGDFLRDAVGVQDSLLIRPVIVLKDGIEITGGQGTQIKPYIINED